MTLTLTDTTRSLRDIIRGAETQSWRIALAIARDSCETWNTAALAGEPVDWEAYLETHGQVLRLTEIIAAIDDYLAAYPTSCQGLDGMCGNDETLQRVANGDLLCERCRELVLASETPAEHGLLLTLGERVQLDEALDAPVSPNEALRRLLGKGGGVIGRRQLAG